MAHTTMYLVRHAESQPSGDLPEPTWPLSPRGLQQSHILVPAMSGLGITALYASPYLRAHHTIAPLAVALNLDITLIDALRERSLGQLPPGTDHRAMVSRYWTDPNFALPDGESNAACALRVTQALSQLAVRHRGETIAVASHGNALSLYLQTIDPQFGFDQWRSMRNPDLFRVIHDGGRATWDGARLPTALE